MGKATTEVIAEAVARLEEALALVRSTDEMDEKRVLDRAANRARIAADKLSMAASLAFINRGYKF